MRCLACSFENPSGRDDCYQCGHLLDLSKLDLTPPRRGAADKLLGGIHGREGRHWRARWRWFRGSRTSAPLAWILSFVPGLGHLLLDQGRWAGGLALAWLVACSSAGALTLRPTGYVMLVQCVAMTEAYRQASHPRPGWPAMLMMSLLTSAFLAVIEMICIGGILW